MEVGGGRDLGDFEAVGGVQVRLLLLNQLFYLDQHFMLTALLILSLLRAVSPPQRPNLRQRSILHFLQLIAIAVLITPFFCRRIHR